MDYSDFKNASREAISAYRGNAELQHAAANLFDLIGYDKARYVYNFTWAGVPIIQLPQDVQLKQELIWEVRPTIIIETGVAWGGSLLLYASLLSSLIDSGYIKTGKAVGIEVDWRESSRSLLEPNPLFNKYCQVIEGSSVDTQVVDRISAMISSDDRVIVFLDSNHAAEHVLSELRLYSPLVSRGSYLIVEDTTIEWHANSNNIRPWGPGNSPITALELFLVDPQHGLSFRRRSDLTDKLLLTGMRDGVIQRA